MTTSEIRFSKLTEDNYFDWVVDAEAALSVKGLWSTVEEDEEFRALDAPVRKKKQREARGYLILWISAEVRDGIVAADTPKKIWDALKTRFCQKTNERKADLIERITSAEQQNDESAATFVNRVETLRRRLKEEHSEEISDSIAMGILLKGVASRFSQTIEALRCIDNLMLATVKDKLIAADERMKADTGKSGGGRALQTSGHQQTAAGQGAKKPWRETRRCYNCKKVGHIAKYCRQPQSGTHSSKYVESSRRSEPSNAAALTMHAPAQTVRDISPPRDRSEKILVDTGATHHMCWDVSKFLVLHPSSIPFVKCGGGEFHDVLGQGTVFIGGSCGLLRLDDVLYVPTLAVNLFSGSAALQKGAKLVGSQNRLEVELRCRVVLRGSAIEGLFQVDGKLLCADSVPQKSVRSFASANVAVTGDVWHKRLGHPAFAVMQKLQRTGAVNNLHTRGNLSEQDVCITCIEAKQSRSPFPASDSTATERLALVHADVIGKLQCKSIGGSMWVLCMLDEYSRYSEVVCLKSKADVPGACWDVLQRWQRQTDYKVKVVRTDGGTEFLGSLQDKFREAGVIHQTSVRYTPQQNGRAERLNRTLLQKTRCLLFQANMPSKFWAEAISTANYLRNLVPTSNSTKTPYELFHQKKPDVARLRVFGCSAYVQLPAPLRKKFDKRSVQGVFVGYEATQKAWRVMCPTDGNGWKLHTSRDVQFLEHINGVEALQVPGYSDEAVCIGDWLIESAETTSDNAGDVALEQQLPLEGEIVEQSADNQEEAAASVTTDEEGEDNIQVAAEMPVRRSNRVTSAPDRFDPAAYAYKAAMDLTDEPKTLNEVRARPDAALWEQAMQEELQALWEKGVYQWVDKPNHKRVLPAKWVYKVKRDEKGAIEKYKARLVAKGFLQKPGVDYGEVFAPASSLVTLRLLLSIAAERDYDVHQLDVKTAFLNGELEEEVYLRPPEGFEDQQGRVWLLTKALYGLKQAAQAWHVKLKNSLAKEGLHASTADPCLFIGQFESKETAYMLVHVDDALIIGTSTAVREAKRKFASLFDVRDLGEANLFLGLELVRDRAAGKLWLGQSQYTENKLEQFGMRNCNSRVTPLEVSQQLGPTGEALEPSVPYHEAVGSLLYLAVCTRPDISHSVGMLSRFVSAPRKEHWLALKGVLRYLRGTVKLGLLFLRGARELTGYTDSDYAGDLIKRRSTSGYVFLSGGAAILWGSKLQTTVAVSTCEAELIAGARAIKEALWLRKLLADIVGCYRPVKLLMDNQSALTLVRNPATGAQTRTKHVDISYNFARHRVITGEIDAQFVCTGEMLADMFTKQLPGPAFRKHREAIGVTFH